MSIKKRKSPNNNKKEDTFISTLFIREESNNFKKRRKGFSLPRLKHIHLPLIRTYSSSLIIIALLLPVLVIAFIMFGPIMKVSQIYIYRQDTLININKAYESVELFRGKNILLLDTATIASRIQKGQSSIQNILFDISLPNTLNINLQAYPAIFQTEKHIILENGVYLSKENINTDDLPFLFLSKDLSEIEIFQEKLNSQDLRSIQLLIHSLPKNIPGFSFTTIQYFLTEKELIVSNDLGTLFIFDIAQDLDRQIRQLSIFQKEQFNVNEKRYVYIDVRIPEKLFLCPYEEEFTCINNLKKIYGNKALKPITQDSSQSPQ